MIVIVKRNSKKLGFMRICKVLKGCYKVGIGLDLQEVRELSKSQIDRSRSGLSNRIVE